jgi:transposase-like protein
MAVVVAFARSPVNTDGRREILGITVMPLEAFAGLALPRTVR